MKKLTIIGIVIIIIGIVLVVFSVSQTGNFEIENRYPTTRGTLTLGFIMMIGGGLIALSPFGKK